MSKPKVNLLSNRRWLSQTTPFLASSTFHSCAVPPLTVSFGSRALVFWPKKNGNEKAVGASGHIKWGWKHPGFLERFVLYMYNTCKYLMCICRSKSISKTLSIYMYILHSVSYIPTIRKCLQYSFPLLFRCIYLQSIKVTDMFMATTTWIWPFKALLNPVRGPEHLQKKILKLGSCVLAAFFETLCLLGIVSSPSYNKRW